MSVALAGAVRPLQALSLTGWTALLGIASMVILVLWGINYGYRMYRGVPDSQGGYTLVTKRRPGR